MAIIGERAVHGTDIATGDFGFGVRTFVQLACKRAHAAHPFFQCLLGMAISFIDGLGGFPQIVKVTQLMRRLWQGCCDGTAGPRSYRRPLWVNRHAAKLPSESSLAMLRHHLVSPRGNGVSTRACHPR
jgi:hypothetical protein